jgi:hypothetical protein
MLYFIVTASIINGCPIRQMQYITGITKLKNTILKLEIKNYKIIIVENNGLRRTYLDELECEVYYTENNYLPTNNKGAKELKDILDCINKYNINDTDFIVKMTGRYILHDESEFMGIVKNIHTTKYDCIIKYGSYYNPVNYKMDNCITGLIGMSCVFIKRIEPPNETDCVEWKWGKVTNLMDNDKIYLVNRLGINICPGGNDYFRV